jgi:acyl CoA:acetate/3-ketoacid CoA transferase beta subunit
MALDKYGIAKRIAQELQDGFYVNLRNWNSYISF